MHGAQRLQGASKTTRCVKDRLRFLVGQSSARKAGSAFFLERQQSCGGVHGTRCIIVHVFHLHAQAFAEVRLIVPNEAARPKAEPIEALLKALARARRWFEMLISGEITSVHALAQSSGLNASYVTRVLRLAFLSPQIVETIVQGKQSEELTLATLFKQLPASWQEQELLLRG